GREPLQFASAAISSALRPHWGSIACNASKTSMQRSKWTLRAAPACGLHSDPSENTCGRGLRERKLSCIHFIGLFDMAHIEALIVLLGIVFLAAKGLSDPFFGLM